MSNLLLATPILSDAAAITAGDETAAGPVANLQRMQPTDVWESESTASYVEIDLGAVTAFNLIAALFLNATATDTWRIRTADTQGNLTAAPTQDTTATALTKVSPEGHMFHWISAGWSNRWIRIDIATAASPLMAGRLYVANALQPAVNYEYGGADGYDDDAVIDRGGGGALHPGGGYNRAVASLTFNIMTEAERHAVREVHRLRGARKDVLFIFDPDATENIGDGVAYVLMQRRRDTIATAFNQHQVAYQLISL